MPDQGGQGVILAEGGQSAGFVLYVDEGQRLVYEYNWFEEERTTIASDEPLPAGKARVTMAFAYDGDGLGNGGTVILYSGDRKIGEGRIEKTVPGRFGIDTFGVGSDSGSPVSTSYRPPFPFSGQIDKVEITLE